VAENFPPNPALDTEATITDLGIGEALVSLLDAKGSPTPVQRTLIRPPESQIGPLEDAERTQRLERSPLRSRYDSMIDRESAFEILKARAEQQAADEASQKAREEAEATARREERGSRGGGRQRQSVGEAMLKSAARSIGSQLGRQIIRGIMGSIFGTRR